MLVWGITGAFGPTGARYFPSIRRDMDADGSTACERDCDDADAGVNPAGVDLPGKYLDENCDGTVTCDPRRARNRGQLVSCVVRECEALVPAGSVDGSLCERVLSNRACARFVATESSRAWSSLRRSGSHRAHVSDLGFEGGELRCGDRCDGGFDLSTCIGSSADPR